MRELPVRKDIRLKNFDYSRDGAYFVTVCVRGRHEMLGTVNVGAGFARPQCGLSECGIIVERNIISLPDKYQDVIIDKHIVMPNHIHLILRKFSDGRADPAPTVGQIIGYLKYKTTKEIDIRGFWQRSYHDRIIRNEEEYQKIWQYIDSNPQLWEKDCYYVKL